MNRKFRVAVRDLKSTVAAAAIIVAATATQAATISTQTDAAGANALFPGANIISFDEVAQGSYSTATIEGTTFSTSNGQRFYISNDYAGQYNTNGISLQNTYNNDAFSTLRIDFGTSISGFGFFFGASDDPWTLSAYNSSNVLVDSLLISPLNESDAGNFFGITGSGIAYATLTGVAGDYIFVDELRVGSASMAVPGPVAGAGLPALMALGGFVWARRRKAAVPAAA